MTRDPQAADSATQPTIPPTPVPQVLSTVAPAHAALAEAATLAPGGETTLVAAAVSRGSVPGYEILGELGRGGMGVVYKAQQVGLGRLVALKMILAGGHAREADLARFRTEGEAIARLQHPNNVQVYEVGDYEGKPFFSLEFCPGGNLDRKLNGTPLPALEAARLVETLAGAMHAAHGRNVIHHDLKPANVLLAEDGTPKVTDFGLAKKVESGSGLTQPGAVMGTPSYMAPEQAQGRKAIGPAADVYALGAILYECLTGRPPFRGSTPLDTIVQVVADEPVRVRQLQPSCPRDLETICHKCLQKEPDRRYASAVELAEDLRRYQAGEPIVARPVGTVERGVKWVRRNPVVASLAAAVLLVLVAGIVVSSYFVYTASEEAEEASRQAAAAKMQARRAEDARHAIQIDLALRARAERDYARVAALLNEMRPEYHDAWETRYIRNLWLKEAPFPLRTFIGHTGAILSVAFSPNSKCVLTVSADRTARLWDTETGQVKAVLKGASEAVAFSPDGKRVLTGSEDHTARLWDVETGQEKLALVGHTGIVYSVAFSPDGNRVLTGSHDSTARMWDAPTRQK
jgi:eukaryotic-like serine/threonine-protein kinase